LNKWQIRRKNKYLVWWKGFIAESNTWKGRENLENAEEAIKEYEKEYQWDIKDMRQQEREERIFKRGELLERFMVKKSFE